VTDLLILTAIDVEARALARHLGLSPVPAAWPPFRQVSTTGIWRANSERILSSSAIRPACA